jgi:hypothetical protein
LIFFATNFVFFFLRKLLLHNVAAVFFYARPIISLVFRFFIKTSDYLANLRKKY